MASQSKKPNCCPFWNRNGIRECRLVESGLFIPTREHILRFCETGFFGDCYHYIGKAATGDDNLAESAAKPAANRRLYTRIQVQEILSVSRYSLAKEASEDILDDAAMVEDLSLGGMRISTHGPISINQVLSFTFDEQFHPPRFQGKGEVRWIDVQQQEGPVTAGLAFIDEMTRNAVKDHLLGLGEKILHLRTS